MPRVKYAVWLGLWLAVASLIVACRNFSQPTVEAMSAISPISQPAPAITYQTHTLPDATLHVLTVPTDSYEVAVELADGLASVREIGIQTGAIAVLNAGFFDPQNGQTTSYVITQGELVADPNQNQRLIGNPDLQPYLEQILNRSEFRRYQCGSETQYDIVAHKAPIPPACSLTEAVGAGPQLLPADTSAAEGFTTYNSEGQLIRDALGGQRRNARTAIGLTAAGEVILAMAAQQPQAPTDSGFSLGEMAAFMRSLGAVKALNLDGGSSSSLYYQGDLYLGRVNAAGDFVERPVRSALLVRLKSE